MKNIQAENIDLENVLFHFSDGDIKSIEEKGLEARIGHNSGGVETHKKVFFSQGISEMLQLVYDLTRVSKDAIDNEKKPVEQKNTAIPLRTAVCRKCGFNPARGGQAPGFFFSGSMCYPLMGIS